MMILLPESITIIRCDLITLIYSHFEKSEYLINCLNKNPVLR